MADENNENNNVKNGGDGGGKYFDPRYEFDAPKYFDFDATGGQDAFDDRWFENRDLSAVNDVLFDFADENLPSNETAQRLFSARSKEKTNNRENLHHASNTTMSSVEITSSGDVLNDMTNQNSLQSRKKWTVNKSAESRENVKIRPIDDIVVAEKPPPPPKPIKITTIISSTVTTAITFAGGDTVVAAEPTKPLAAIVRRRSKSVDRANLCNSSKPTDTKNILPSRIKPTIVKPFNFQSREDEFLEKRRRAYEEYLKKEQEKIKQPQTSRNEDTKAPRRHCTVSKPFNFLTDGIHARNEEKLKAKQKLDEEERKKAAEFHAKQATVLKNPPFVPTLNHHPPIIKLLKPLETEKRAIDRKKYDEHLRERELEKERILSERKLELEKQEEEIIKILRRRAEHKAQPVKHYKGIDPLPEPNITIPESPHFHTDDRLKNRHLKRINSVV